MYLEDDHIEQLLPGQRGEEKFKYRVIGRHGNPIHHTNDLEDARQYFFQCRRYWLRQEALEND